MIRPHDVLMSCIKGRTCIKYHVSLVCIEVFLYQETCITFVSSRYHMILHRQRSAAMLRFGEWCVQRPRRPAGLALCVRTGKGGDRLEDRTEAGG